MPKMGRVLCAGIVTILIFVRIESLVLGRPAWAPRACFILAGSRIPQAARKRPRERSQTPSQRPTINLAQKSTAGAFVERLHGGAWVRAGAKGGRQHSVTNGRATMISIHFEPPPMDDLAQGFGRAAAWGLFGALVPVWTRERLMEKEAGLAVDDAAELEALMEEEEEEEDTCLLCNNSNEVECLECNGKGFFVGASAQPRKCTFCDGLGAVECPECIERREDKRRSRELRRPTLRLPPASEDDFPDIPFFPFER